jgi:hypothetical protein
MEGETYRSPYYKQFSEATSHFLPLAPKYSPAHPILTHPNLHVFLKEHKIHEQSYVMYLVQG